MENAKTDYNIAVVIGNGFDLNLGLKTSFQDFIASPVYLKNKSKLHYINEHVEDMQEKNNWIDMEIALKEIAIEIPLLGTKLKKEYDSLSGSLHEFIEERSKIKVDFDKGYYSRLIKNLIEKNVKNLYVNFNYTPTLYDLFKSCGVDDCTDIHMLHGSIESKSIVFGVEDNAGIDKSYDYLYKTSKPYYNPSKVLRLMKNIKVIVFMGHSLGETDHHFFSLIFRKSCKPLAKSNKENFHFLFYYYVVEDIIRMKNEIRKMIEPEYSMMDFYMNNIVEFKPCEKND